MREIINSKIRKKDKITGDSEGGSPHEHPEMCVYVWEGDEERD